MMMENKLKPFPESDILANNSTPVIQKPISMMPETDSASPVPETNSPKVDSGGSASKHGHVRRYSTGNIGIPYKSVKILSRYLAASTGSCHDNCKYGTRLDLEPKTPTSPMSGRRMEKPGKGLEPGKTKLTISFTPSVNFNSQKADFSILSKTEVPSPGRRETALLKQFSLPMRRLTKSSSLPTKVKLNSEIEDKEMRFFVANSPGASGNRRQNKLETIREMETSASDEKKTMARGTISLSALRTVKKVLTQPIVSLSPKCPGKRVSSMNIEKSKSQKGVSEYKHRSRKDVPEKTLHVTKMSSENRTARSSHNIAFSTSSSSIHKDKNLKHAQGSSTLAHKLLRRGQIGSRDGQSPSSPDKSLRHVKQGNRTTTSSSSSSKNNQSGSFSEYHKPETENNGEKAKVEVKHTPGNGEVLGAKGKGSPGRKLNFRKETVRDPRPVISAPRRLKFKRRLSDSGSQINKVETIRRSNLRNNEIHIDDGEISVANSEPGKVVLKHQDREEKKAVQNLLNNMIEETANKLAENKKGKVKALVGAFETVISLQDDSTPSPMTEETELSRSML